MNNKPIISIIIPVYNAEKTISTCLDSLFAQTYNSLELLFVNDCCTDNSFEVIRKFMDENSHKTGISAKIITHEKNRGVAAARNTGLDNASGEYIYYVDSDDWMESDLIETLVKEAETKKSDIVGCEWELCFNKNSRWMKQPDVDSPLDAFHKMCAGILRWNLWLFLVKRSLYTENQIQFNEGQNMGEDMMVMGKLFLCATSMSMIHQPFYKYNQTNSASITKDKSAKYVNEVTHNLNELESFYVKKFPVPDEHIPFLKLNLKLPFLMTDNPENFKIWESWFPEANNYIIKNKSLPLRTRAVQLLAKNKNFWALKLYHRFLYSFIYGVIYK